MHSRVCRKGPSGVCCRDGCKRQHGWESVPIRGPDPVFTTPLRTMARLVKIVIRVLMSYTIVDQLILLCSSCEKVR